jgi:hypothetical protein
MPTVKLDFVAGSYADDERGYMLVGVPTVSLRPNRAPL